MTEPSRESGRAEAAGGEAVFERSAERCADAASSPKAANGRRPRAPAIHKLARDHAGAAVAALAAVMEDPNATPAARVSAASALLNWAHGKGVADRAGAGGKEPTEQVIRLRWGSDAKS